LNQLFISSAPTKERLAEIFRCLIWGNVQGYEQSPRGEMRCIFGIHGNRRYIEDGHPSSPFSWDMLDPDFDERVAYSHSLVADRVRRRWPLSFGHLETHPDGLPAGFRWADSAPELLWGGFDNMTSDGQWTRTIIARPGRDREPIGHGEAEKGFASSTPPCRVSSPVELPCQGRIWYALAPKCHPGDTGLTTRNRVQ
jgi:hypothetical protein